MLSLACKSRRRGQQRRQPNVQASEGTDACLSTTVFGQTRLWFLHLKAKKQMENCFMQSQAPWHPSADTKDDLKKHLRYI